VPQPLSAGVLLYRRSSAGDLEVLLIHPGGPYWARKDSGAWMIPKGGIAPGETHLQAALREYEEELGSPLASTPFRLCTVRQAGGKVVEVFAAEGDFDPDGLQSAHFEMEWPPRSGQRRLFPECDSARWMTLGEARRMMLPSQLPILDALESALSRSGTSKPPAQRRKE
jgi:predicted NUDIX family NTP pyrophosphohydrolase